MILKMVVKIKTMSEYVVSVRVVRHVYDMVREHHD